MPHKYPNLLVLDRRFFVLVVDRGIDPVWWDGSEKAKSLGRKAGTTEQQGQRGRIWHPHKDLPQYVEVLAKCTSSGCTFSLVTTSFHN
jgi:hypothetical protein